ncbi:MAG: RsmD family RNA methyltransferase [Deltaproteobacteria bacterium]|jgi:16S rRNA (guanine(966)-N(2))-methyltransferase RsmD|nr:RsmD family RNA methyltransferase [Deltaproteobacteria bacterium]
MANTFGYSFGYDMRILAGKYKGQEVCSPPHGTLILRPTMAATKNSLFAMLTNLLNFEGINVLDLYSGSGSLGFESLSRGAKFVTFIEKRKPVVACIHETGARLNIPRADYKTFCTKVESFINKRKAGHHWALSQVEHYDLIFSDAPYRKEIVLNGNELVKEILESNLYKRETIFVIELASTVEMLESFESGGRTATRLKAKQSGDTSFYIYKIHDWNVNDETKEQAREKSQAALIKDQQTNKEEQNQNQESKSISNT